MDCDIGCCRVAERGVIYETPSMGTDIASSKEMPLISVAAEVAKSIDRKLFKGSGQWEERGEKKKREEIEKVCGGGVRSIILRGKANCHTRLAVKAV